MKVHASHKTRISMDASSYDEICELCGATDSAGSDGLIKPCPKWVGGQYDEAYFLRGKATGKSLYENYRWMPELTVPMVCAMIRHLGIEPEDSILDFGCARGYTVRAFREMDYDARGVDASKWAIENCDPEVSGYVSLVGEESGHTSLVDWVIAKDVLEHVPEVANTITRLMGVATTGVFAVVPLSDVDGCSYVVPEYELDVTHIHRRSLPSWARLFAVPGWSVEVRYRVVGVKDNYAQYPTGNGFIVARRLT